MTLYEQVGGETAMDGAVTLFYQKVLVDPRVNGFFEGVDMNRQRLMQKKFLTLAFGGPTDYTGQGMNAAHKKLVDRGMNDQHFDVIVEHLAATLKEMGVEDKLINEAAEIAETVRNDVLCR